MKKIYTFTTAILFLMNVNFGFAQDCMPETREDDAEINKKVAKAIKFYCQDNELQFDQGVFSSKKVKGEYLRHSIIKEWDIHTRDNGEKYRNNFVATGVKTAKGCQVVVLYIRQVSLGAGAWGGIEVEHGLEFDKKYFKNVADCDCILKTQDWLGDGTKNKSQSQNESNQNTNTTKQNTSTETKPSTVAQGKDAASLPKLDKNKPGYTNVKSGTIITWEGYKKGGEYEGESRMYNDEGKIESLQHNVKGLREGYSAEFYENGKMKTEGNYKKDQKDGEWKRYSEEGKLAGIDIYVDGEKQ